MNYRHINSPKWQPPQPHTALLAIFTGLLALLLALGVMPREDAWIGVGSSVAIIIVQIVEYKWRRDD